MLDIEDVHFAYGDQSVLRGLDVTAKEGEVVGLVGPNGAGKSTLLRLISGVLRPQKGRIFICGKDISAMTPKELAQQVAFVPQHPAIPPNFMAIEIVLMGRTPHIRFFQKEGVKDLKIVRDAMEETGSWSLAHRLVGTLSGGERQRVLIARALAQEPTLLLLDEPTASLDLMHQSGILDLVKRVQRSRGGLVVMAIHDLSLAAQYCHNIYIIHQERIFAGGRPVDVLTADTVSHVYGTEVCILAHPKSGAPVVLPLVAQNAGIGESKQLIVSKPET